MESYSNTTRFRFISMTMDNQFIVNVTSEMRTLTYDFYFKPAVIFKLIFLKDFIFPITFPGQRYFSIF